MLLHDDLLLGKIVVDLGFVPESTVAACLREQREAAGDNDQQQLAEMLIARGALDREQMRCALAEQERRLGEAVIGPYRLVRRIGHGSMGTVYEARVAATGTAVALKRISDALTSRPEELARFRREATIGMEISHPHIVATLDFGEDRRVPYLVMELVTGGSLGARLKRSGRIEEGAAIAIVAKLLGALGYAHERGLVHRDVKPANVLFDAAGEPKLSDFGLVKPADQDSTFTTAAGIMVGTPHYVAPEQIRADRDIDGRADLYALGCSFFHLLTGHPPFPGTIGVEVMHRHLDEPAPDPRAEVPAISAGCAQVVRAMMIKDRRRRYAAPDAVAADLERVLRGEPPAMAITLLEHDRQTGRGPARAGRGPARPTEAPPVPRAPRSPSRVAAAGRSAPRARAVTRAAGGRSPWLLPAAGAAAVLVLGLAVLAAVGGEPAPATPPADATPVASAPPPPPPPVRSPALVAPTDAVLESALRNAPSARVDLTAEGGLDWVQYAAHTPASVTRKAGTAPELRIGDLEIVGTGARRLSGLPGAFAWNDAAAGAVRGGAATGLAISGRGNGFRFTVPADTSLRLLRVHAGLSGARGRLSARLDDDRVRPLEERHWRVDPGRHVGRIWEIRYRAATAGQRLHLAWTVDAEEDPAGGVAVLAVTLATAAER